MEGGQITRPAEASANGTEHGAKAPERGTAQKRQWQEAWWKKKVKSPHYAYSSLTRSPRTWRGCPGAEMRVR